MYPAAKSLSDHVTVKKEHWLVKLIKDPIILIYFGSIVIGILLNMFHIERAMWFRKMNEVCIPISSFMLIVSIGYSMRFSRIQDYKNEVIGISLLKYIFTPLLIISLSFLLGLNSIGDGTLFKTMIVMSALPTGFNSVIPTQLYKLDTHLANSCWIVTTGLLAIVVPILALFVA